MVPAVVVTNGLPGSGKSTLADALARQLAVPCFAGDWLFGALAPHGVLTGLPRRPDSRFTTTCWSGCSPAS